LADSVGRTMKKKHAPKLMAWTTQN
jgi:hypothetical protein